MYLLNISIFLNQVALRDLVVSSFESYRDESTFKDRPVKIYKRAQILVADIWAAFEGMNFGYGYCLIVLGKGWGIYECYDWEDLSSLYF